MKYILTLRKYEPSTYRRFINVIETRVDLNTREDRNRLLQTVGSAVGAGMGITLEPDYTLKTSRAYVLDVVTSKSNQR